MKTKNISLSNSNVYARLAAVKLSRSERENAVAALQDGEKIAEAILSVANFLRLLVTTPALKPNFKH
jgi:hypothetical protein